MRTLEKINKDIDIVRSDIRALMRMNQPISIPLGDLMDLEDEREEALKTIVFANRTDKESVRNGIDPGNDDFGAVCNCAVRYCLGRRSYMPKLVTDYIIPLLPKLTEKTLACFRMDIENRQKAGFDFGMGCDVETWNGFYKAVCDEMERRRTNGL